MKKIIYVFLCILFLTANSPAMFAEGWNIPLVSKLADYSTARKAFLFASTLWTIQAIKHLYPTFKHDYNTPKSNIFQQYRVSLGVTAVTAGVGAFTYGVYCWPHLKSLYS